VIAGFCSFGALDHQRRVLHQSSLLYLSEDPDSTSYHSPREDLARHVGCRPRNLNLCFGSRMEFDWPRKKSDLRVSRKNETRDRKNWGKKYAAREYLKPEESIKAK
jgi:hypothetical protein